MGACSGGNRQGLWCPVGRGELPLRPWAEKADRRVGPPGVGAGAGRKTRTRKKRTRSRRPKIAAKVVRFAAMSVLSGEKTRINQRIKTEKTRERTRVSPKRRRKTRGSQKTRTRRVRTKRDEIVAAAAEIEKKGRGGKGAAKGGRKAARSRAPADGREATRVGE